MSHLWFPAGVERDIDQVLGDSSAGWGSNPGPPSFSWCLASAHGAYGDASSLGFNSSNEKKSGVFFGGGRMTFPTQL